MPTNEAVLSSEVAMAAWSLEGDEILRRRADSLIGNVAVGAVTQMENVPDDGGRIMNLAEAIERARSGNPEALALVRANVSTDYFERAYKSGFVSEVELEKTEDGRLIQNGQTLESVHVNSLRHICNEKLQERSKIEVLNGLRDQYYADIGLLKDHARIIISTVHDQMSDEEAEEAGFFTHTRSLSIQLMTEREGKIIIQSAFVAGRENLSSEAFDVDASARLAKKLNLDFSGMSSEDILASPIIIHKEHLPNLVLSAVQLFDESATEITGQRKFFGRDDVTPRNEADYSRKFQESKEALDSVQTNIAHVVERLIAFKPATPSEATSKLAELNDALLKSRIIADRTIDARVLGTKAAYYVNHARYLYESNTRLHEISLLQRRIEKEGRSSSCPVGSKNDFQPTVDMTVEWLGGPLETSEPADEESSKTEDCEFVSEECPKCGTKNVLTICKKGKYYGACGCHT